MTEDENARSEKIREEFLSSVVRLFGEDLAFSTVDALFAIRDEKPWRGITDPKEIAHTILRQGKLG